ncbi:MAG: hypothetical protein ACI8S6_001494 [Myxococcota bacterium]|jgi:hypothetical protein
MMGWVFLGLLTAGAAWADEDDDAGSISSTGGTVGGVPGRSAMAAQPPPKWRLTYEAMAAARLNPLGLNLEARPAIRRRLYASTSTIGRDNYADLAPTLTVTPAFVRGGVSARVQPVAMLRVGGRIEGINYFGGFDQVQSWSSAGAAVWDDDTQDERGVAGENYPTTGWFAAGEVLLRAKVKQVAVLNQSRLLYANVDLQEGDSVFYEITYDVLVANEGLVQVNDLSTVWVPESMPLTAGARWSYVRAIHDAEPDALATEALHRVGPLVAWTFRSEEGSQVGNLSAFALAQWWLQHPYRTGQVTNQAVPYFVIGLSMRGDLRPW